ncbi:MAG TPA: DUF6036 family nucleotidyltransferase [Thermoanaerobaculia bacterium]|jgi:hypothetical protein|nr:DUF6036 family nucleotidyltransferase [Thermoanaerobaculia bacterium]
MRDLADGARIRRLMQVLSEAADRETRVYFTGGASAVLIGWRRTTIDVDLRFVPDSDRLLRAIPSLKETLRINVELASPSDFIPELPGWQERSRFIGTEGRLSFFHYDFYSQALAKIERGHAQDVGDVEEMLRRGLVEPQRALDLFAGIEPLLYRYPAINPAEFRRAAEGMLKNSG